MDKILELTSQAESSHFWFRGFRQFVGPLLDRAAAGRTNLTVLDCGAGTGFNLSHLARYGSTYAMDLSATGLGFARKTGRPLARADATRIPFAAASFDLVTSFDMLQCVPDDGAAVREIARVLKPGGHFVGNVAALEVLHGDHAELAEEVRRYTRASVERLLRGSGLEPVVVRYAFASTFPLMLGLRGWQRLRGLTPSSREITVPPAPINAALSAVLTIEAQLARHIPMPIGSSVLFLASKAL